MRSMTGFGRGEARSAKGDVLFRVELSSVNRKQFELKLVLPRELLSFEGGIRKIVGSRVSRGALTLRAEVLSAAGEPIVPSVKINRKNVALLREQLAELGLPESALGNVLLVPGVIEEAPSDFAARENEQALSAAVEAALEALVSMRTTEGTALEADLALKLSSLEAMLSEVEPLTAELPELQREKLLRRLADANLPVDLSDERILRETVVFSDRLDVSEEITRLRSHFAHFRSFLANGDEALGRSMDFLTQEIFREINTLGNKAASTGVSPLVVRMKTEAEKIREQVQNIE